MNVERHPSLLCDRIRHAAAAFMTPARGWPVKEKRGSRRKIVHARWVGLDEGNIHLGPRLTDVDYLTALGRIR